MVDIEREEKVWQLREYDCGWCNYTFQQYVRFVKGSSPVGYEAKNNTSSQVQCPKCKNFLKTWLDGIKVGETKHRPIKRVIEQ